MAKTSPIGVRFNEDLIKALAEDELADSPQKVLNFLTDFYQKNKTIEIDYKKLFDESRLFMQKASKEKEPAPAIKENNSTETENVKDGEIDQSELLKQIDELKKEKIPKERDTSLGRKIWYAEQGEKIKKLEKKLK